MVSGFMFHKTVLGFIAVTTDYTNMSSMTEVIAFNMIFHDILSLAYFSTDTALKALLG